MSFRVTHQPLDANFPEEGSIAILPWDSETFGFSVAELKPGTAAAPPTLKSRLETWAREQKVRLVSAALPSHRADWLNGLQAAGFRVIDTVVEMGFKNLQRAKLRPSPLPLRKAEPGDLVKLKQMAMTGFNVGRYSADPFFARELANRRYEKWVDNCFNHPQPGTLILVADHEGEPVGFTISVSRDEDAVCQLTCVRPDFQKNIIGYALATGQTHALKAAGIERTHCRLSVQSVPLIQMNEHLGNSILESEYVLHWHAGTAE